MRRSAVLLLLLGAGCASQQEVTAPEPQAPPEMPAVLGDRSPKAPEEPILRPVQPQKRAVAITGATLMLGNGARIEDGTIVLSGGEITAVGPSKTVRPPKGAQVVDGRGRFVTPGLIDTHSHMGVYAVPHVNATADGNEMTDPTTPYVFSEHAFWPQDPAIQRAVMGGVTTIQVLPGSGNVIGGRAVTLKLTPRRETRAMRFPGAPFGLKMACGENPKRVYGSRKRQPMSRMGNIAQLRKAFIAAQQYAWDMKAYERDRAAWEAAYREAQESGETEKLKKEPKQPPRKLGAETLAAVLRGEILVHIHCYRADEMLQMLALGEELGFSVSSFHHATEAYKIADVLKEKGVTASMWADWWGFKLEAYDAVEENAAMVAAAGADAIIHSDSNIGIQRLNQEAAKALHSGRRLGLELGEDDALKWITLNPAKALGVAEKTGTLEEGKMADVVLWDQNPFSIYAKAQQVYIDGRRVYDARRPVEAWSDFETGTRIEGEVQ